MKAVTILSGGMDSATLAFSLAEKETQQHFLSFNYGQKHKKELLSAKAIADLLKCQHDVIDLSSVGPLLRGSALTDTQEISMPEGYYAEENMRLTVVPNRNAMMLAIAWAVAISDKADHVYYGAHAGDHYIYPDCRIEFVNTLSDAFYVGTYGLLDQPLPQPQAIAAPFIDLDKAAILKIGLEIGVPYEVTWTCYQGGEVSCGTCGSCQERLEAFKLNGVEDPLPYLTRTLIRPGETVQK